PASVDGRLHGAKHTDVDGGRLGDRKEHRYSSRLPDGVDGEVEGLIQADQLFGIWGPANLESFDAALVAAQGHPAQELAVGHRAPWGAEAVALDLHVEWRCCQCTPPAPGDPLRRGRELRALRRGGIQA